MMLRGRDLVAALLAILLTRMAWTENYMSESLSASFRLAFYSPWTSSREQMTAPPVPLDVDGDGTVEAVAMATRLNSTNSPDPESWTIQVLDLKPLHKSSIQKSSPLSTGVAFRPNVLFASQPLSSTLTQLEDDNEKLRPLKMTSGQVMVHPHKHHHHHHAHRHLVPKEDKKDEDGTDHVDDRSRHYFCGVDWHDAANNCHQHCPSGSPGDCPDGMTCYADTPCDAKEESSTMGGGDVLFSQQTLELTPGGGLPSIVTFWSDGTVSLHSLTADAPKEDEKSQQHKKRRSKRQHDPPRLELRLMWRKPILQQNGGMGGRRTEEFDLLLLGAEDVDVSSEEKKKELGKYGMVVVGGTDVASDGGGDDHHFVHALDAMTGESLWEGTTKTEKNETSLVKTRGSSSWARRRSRIPSLASSQDQQPGDMGLPNCLVAYRHSLLDPSTQALPYAYWSTSDARLMAAHLDRRRQRKHKRQHLKQEKGKKWRSSLVQTGGKSRNHEQKKKKKQSLLYGRPNVLLLHHEGGFLVSSLKNGRSVCHVSLLDRVLYADLNHDGIVDHIQVITDDNTDLTNPATGEFKDKWVTDLAQRVEVANAEFKERNPSSISSRLCHILALSGIPAREELFSAPLCTTGSGPSRRGDVPSITSFLNAAPPLVVERMDGSTKRGSDVVVALNNGITSRFQAPNGKLQWQVYRQDALPTWGPDASGSSFLGRIDFVKAANSPWIRPILVAGEDGMALLSTGQGRLLATTKFPQTAIGRPILADLSGDGTADVIIVSTDAIWGYQVVVRTGGSILFRILVGLLLVGMAVALLRNRFGQRQGDDKRSTDE